jgi:hypothetical protein
LLLNLLSTPKKYKCRKNRCAFHGCLTLELSGGEAVRLERNVRRLRRCMLGRQQLPRRAYSLNNRLPQKYQL